MQRLLLLGAAMVAPACTDPLQPGSGDDAGSGTGTLHVEANISGTGDGESSWASFVIRIEKNGVPVTDAKVTITSRAGHSVLTSTDIRFPGRWTGRGESYDLVYQLDVESGGDTVRGVRVDGPPLGVFTAPAENTTIDPASPLEIRWEPAPADQTSLIINPQGAAFPGIEDNGSFTIPASTWVSNPAGSHAVGLIRRNTVTPAGADEGSRMSVSTEQYLHICDRPATGLCSS